ncbi:MAG: hypothetical protein J0L93_05860 [Deltaproteobacteria bacterium]|nr:hypothetical protein [Deltaproteobacteria bacterium]
MNFRALFYFILISFLTPIYSQAQEENLSAEYREGFSAYARNVLRLKHFDIILVPGFLSDTVIATGRHPLLNRLGLGHYFDDQLRWFHENKVHAIRTKIESEEIPDVNAQFIRGQIEKAKRPVILITHSKGSVDALHSLIQYPELQKKVKGWISLQGGFGGSPVADWIDDSACLGKCAGWLLKRMGGTRESLKSLRESDSKVYLQANADEIASFQKRIPVISFGSWIDRQPWRLNTLLFLTRNAMLEDGIKNDGLVPVSNTVLPGSKIVQIPDVDHADPVMKSWVRHFDRVKMTQALCSMLLKRI